MLDNAEIVQIIFGWKVHNERAEAENMDSCGITLQET